MDNPPNSKVTAGDVVFDNEAPFVLISGPCQLENRDHAIMLAIALSAMCKALGISYVFKASFDKANRTSLSGKRGMGLDGALPIFDEIRHDLEIPVLTDVHNEAQCALLKDHVDVLQIPAFLCRQTDLLVAAAETGLPVNVKKGQFLAPWDMRNVIQKVTQSGNPNVLLTDRGTSFGYNTLVSDMRGLPEMASTGAPVIFDATHSVQQPGGLGGASGGQRHYVPVLARAAVAVGVAGLFMECHDNPDEAPSDGPVMVPLTEMEGLLKTLVALDKTAKENRFSFAAGG
ncbi:MAG: 3-deoxy-8-phosphooctulonate synthase [Pseudomonadota bacterium]